ncbi:hypothetical protein N658DRAFT_46541 [Parathielavia hyrcaniae]|uniref:Uncharacterized protein n=1 Tax=Parathielavia hyrcaniae TaxID=113614 RepID=A0AAN6PQS3_9PEZI|nr:hypothetical protein N658DRAFT_46541 [Parathielavia hyrcaniae]
MRYTTSHIVDLWLGNVVGKLRPDHVVVRLWRSLNAGGQGSHVEFRDLLWVECQSPAHDTPARWKDLTEQTCDRLREAHPFREVFVILAVGLKWMFFKWNPNNANGSPLQVLGHHPNTAWTIGDPRFSYDPHVVGQRHVTLRNPPPPGNVPDIVDTRLAYSLDFYALAPNGFPLHMNDLILLTRYFSYVYGAMVAGVNPPHWS